MPESVTHHFMLQFTNGKHKILFFDFNGVLILDNPKYSTSELENRIYKQLGTSLDDTKEVQKIINELNWDEKTFWDYINTSWNGVIPNTELLNWIKDLKDRGHKTAIVSNTSGLIFRKYQKAFFGYNLEDIFDVIVISSEVKQLKPNTDIYQTTLNKIGCLPEETVMIDDSKRYLEGAKLLGIHTILFENNELLKKSLNELDIEV